MKTSIFKKTITLTYLTIFLFGIFAPFNQSFAQTSRNLSITSSKPSPNAGENVIITARATANNGRDGKQVQFSYSPITDGVAFYPNNTCTETLVPDSGNIYGCTINFSSAKAGTFTLTATDGSLISNPLTLLIGGGTPSVPTDTTYTPLAPLPGEVDINGKVIIQTDPGCTKDASGKVTCTNPCPFGNYLNIMIKVIIGMAAVLAMVMITIGGIEYMTSELVSGKENGKETITNAILGLLIALGAYLILNTINPQLLNACLDKLPQATITINDLGGESTQAFQPINQTTLQNNFGITLCNGTGGKAAVASIGQQFRPQTEYSQTKRNTTSSSTIYVDCSSFVDQVYTCAGLASPGNNTTEIFSKGTSVNGATFDFSTLHSGDLVGWKPSDDPSGNGHVAIYLGGGQILDTQDTNNPTQIRSLSSIQSRITYVYWP